MIAIRKLGILTVALTLSGAALAQQKVAVLDVQAAILQTQQAQDRLKELRAQPAYAENRKELDKVRGEYEALIQQLQKDLAVMSSDQQEAQRKKIEEKRADLEHVMRKLQIAEQELAQGLMNDLAPKMETVVRDLIADEKIGLLIDRKAALHVEEEFNITPKVTERLNRAK
ncbi:MAG: OmpH family outer membrane protein [Spongiibacteraceae bacterium]|nr:OmpH family outer membrane protein [Spongiibacteraceae bacterium]